MRRVVQVAILGLVAAVLPRPARAIDPFRSFERLVTSNGFGVVSFDRTTRKVDTFLEHSYRFAAPRNDPSDLCFAADESRDLAHDFYFGVRSTIGSAARRGEWLTDVPLDDARYVTGTGIIETHQHAGDGRALEVTTWSFMPMALEAPVLVSIVRVTNEGTAGATVEPWALFNFHLGVAGGGREPSADGEEASWDASRRAFYEYGPSQGTVAYVALSNVAAASVSSADAGAYARLRAAGDLDGIDATTAPTSDVVPGVQAGDATVLAGASTWFAVAVVWALDENAGPVVDAVRAWAGARTPEQLVQAERDAWTAWHTPPPAGLDDAERELWLQSNAFLRMGQVREPGAPAGQILASLPPGLGNLDAQWNIAWVRDMAYATVALSRAGHLDEARRAIEFQLRAGPGRHTTEVGRPYRISVTRYFGNGAEESDCNADGPNIEYDGFGLFLWSVGEWVRAGGDTSVLRGEWPKIRDEIADVLVSLLDERGIVRADSSIWEVHWNGRERHFTYTSLAAARGLCDAAEVARALGENDDAARWAEAGARVRDGVVRWHTDRRGALAQSSEDLAAGHGYVDAAAIEAIDWGIVDPRGVVAQATLAAVSDNLRVASGHGFMRNDDGGWYDSQEWIFVDLRMVPALRAAGQDTGAAELRSWIAGQAGANDLHVSELHDATTAGYAGSIPMIGFGAGTWVIALSGDVLGAACGAYAPEPEIVRPDAGAAADAGPACTTCGPPPSDGGCGSCAVGSDARTRSAPLGAIGIGFLALLAVIRRAARLRSRCARSSRSASR